MKKQNTKINVSNNGGDGGDRDRHNDTIAVAGNISAGDIMKQIEGFLILSYGILFITSTILFCKFIYNLKSAYLMSVNKEALCSGSIYENETLRNQIYILFKNTKSKENFQKTNQALFITTAIIFGIILLIKAWYTYKDYRQHSSKTENNGGTLMNVYLTLSGTSISSLLCIISFIILSIGLYFTSRTLNNLYNISADYASKVATLKATIFTPEKLNQLRIVHARETNTPTDDITSSTITDTTKKTYGALVTLEENINRRLLRTNESGDVQTTGDVNDVYNSYRKTDDGQDTLIGLIQFTRNTDDYNLLQSAVCGQNVCGSQGIGKRIISLSPENFALFMNDPSDSVDLTHIISSSTNTNTNYPSLLQQFVAKVAKYDVALASDLKDLPYNDPIWNSLAEVKTQADVPLCGCVKNPLNLDNKDKMQVQSILNYLATLSNGDPSEEIQKTLGKFQGFLIIACVYIAYIVFHLIYNIFDKKSVVGAYFSFLLILAITLGLAARLH
jgi:hypothetical protein